MVSECSKIIAVQLANMLQTGAVAQILQLEAVQGEHTT